MGFFFWIGQLLLLLGVVFASPIWLALLWRVPKTRAGFAEKWGFWSTAQQARFRQWQAETQADRSSSKTIWVHAVSVGEFLAIKPLVQQLLDASVAVIVSTTTLTGQQLAQEAFGTKAFVCYFPFDSVWAIDAVMNRLKPDAILLTETELWPTFVHRLVDRFKTPIFLINGRLSDKSFRRYLWIKQWVIQPLLGRLAGLFMQSEQDDQRVIALGANPQAVEVWGNLKLDLPEPSVMTQVVESPLRQAWFFGHQTVSILTIASTHAGEERLFVEQVLPRLWQQLPHLKVVLAPRHPERTAEVARLLQEQGVVYQKRSTLGEAVDSSILEPLLLLDTVGELKTIFGYSSVAVVAGSFLPTLGGHNILEPIAMQTPTVFGAYMSNFSEIAKVVLAAEAGIQVADVDALSAVLLRLLQSPEERTALVKAGNRFLGLNQGNTKRLVETILNRLINYSFYTNSQIK